MADSASGARPLGPANIAVDETGAVGVAWFDRRNASIDGSVDLYFAASLDGGTTFLPAARVTDVTSVNATEANGRVAGRFGSGGDYFGLEPRPGGGFQALWADSRTGAYQLFTAPIRIRTH